MQAIGVAIANFILTFLLNRIIAYVRERKEAYDIEHAIHSKLDLTLSKLHVSTTKEEFKDVAKDISALIRSLPRK